MQLDLKYCNIIIQENRIIYLGDKHPQYILCNKYLY